MENRFQNIQRVLEDGEAALFFSAAACRYLTDFSYTAGGVLVLPDTAYLLTDSRYIEAAAETVTGLQCVCCDGLYRTVETLLGQHGIRRLLVERETSLAVLDALREKLSVEPVADGRVDRALAESRLVKSADERERLIEAQRLTEMGFSHILSFLKAGVTEREAALELEFFIRRAGADGVSFDFIVVSGKNTSKPHGVPTDKPLENGDFVTMDFGALYRGYHADMTRTVAIGGVSAEQRRVYDTVLQAQQAALDVLHAGISGREGDAAARDVIAAAGYGAYFGHGTGHGVGVEIHEAPSLSPRAAEQPLPIGCVVTVEPGIYLPGRFGVRIEDMVMLTADGCENLTKAPKELIIL